MVVHLAEKRDRDEFYVIPQQTANHFMAISHKAQTGENRRAKMQTWKYNSASCQ